MYNHLAKELEELRRMDEAREEQLSKNIKQYTGKNI